MNYFNELSLKDKVKACIAGVGVFAFGSFLTFLGLLVVIDNLPTI